MPGICGIIADQPASQSVAAVQAMVDGMGHESFYNAGKLANERLGLAVGWVCDSGSFSDCLPVWNEARDVCLVFSGEHFGDPQEADSLRKAGHNFAEVNASYLVHLYEEHGLRFLQLLNGSFSGLLLDLREFKAVLFNDRYGLNRLYYHETRDGFYFASEAKALLRVLPRLRQLQPAGLAESFVCGAVLQNRSLFTEVSLLPGGAAWTFGPGRATNRQSYFHRLDWESQTPLSAADYYQSLKETFGRVLPRYFSGKLPVALSLTGGLDTRMIAAWDHRPPFTLRCYTFGGMDRESEDVRISRQVAAAYHQHHEVIALTQDFFRLFPALAEKSIYITDGAMDVTGAVGLFVNRQARNIAPVRLTGNYGSEILRGNVAFKAKPPCLAMFAKEFLPEIERAKLTFHAERQQPVTAFIAFKQVPWHHFGRLALEQSQLCIRSPYLDNALVRLAFQAPEELSVSRELAHRLIEDGNPALALIPTDFGLLGPRRARANRWRRLYQEFLHRADYASDYGMPQWLAKADGFLAPLGLGRFFLGRHKYAHFRIWYRNELSEYVKEVLLDARSLARGYLNKQQVEKMVVAHIKGRGNYTVELHKLLSAELLHRTLVERQ